MPSNLATPQATAEHLKAKGLKSRTLGNAGLTVSAMGFGGYRIHPSAPEHGPALEKALLAGVNLIDTSSNYTDGGSEKLISRVLGKLLEQGQLHREQVVVVTKAGYLQGQNFELSQKRKQEGKPFPDLVPYAEGLEHCIHPEFLEDQLTRSLDRLGLEALDVFLLHNPEYYLAWAQAQGIDQSEARGEFEARLVKAFACLEDMVAAGRIGCYGISSNTFVAPDTAYDFVSLATAWELAEQAKPSGHSLKVVQFPFNLLEPEAATLTNQPDGQTVLELAREKGLGVLANRPLNAMCGDTLLRLAETPSATRTEPGQIMELLSDLRESEDQLKNSLLPNLGLSRDEWAAIGDHLSAAQVVADNWQELKGVEHWRSFKGQYLLPRINGAMGYLAGGLKQSVEGLKVLDAHLTRVSAAFQAVEDWHRAESADKAERIKQRAVAMAGISGEPPALEALAQRALYTTPGVGCVLVGMRRESYVDQALAELKSGVDTSFPDAFWPGMRDFSREFGQA